MAKAWRGGFTLIELMVVIAIIAVLIAIVIPVIGKLRQSAYAASTQNELGQIESACNRYYDDFRAFPGPISNSDLESQPGIPVNGTGQGGTATGANIVDSLTTTTIINNSAGSPKYILTASENLVLGLCGGLWYNPNASTPGIQYVDGGTTGSVANPTTLIGAGPQSLSPYSAAGGTLTSNKQYTSYIPVNFPGSTMMLNGNGSPETGTSPFITASGSFGDSIVPVFTDQFPDHMPILYVRARKGAKGILSDGVVIDPTSGNLVAHYNYDLRELTPYTAMTVNGGTTTIWQAAPPSGTQTATGITYGSGINGEHGLQQIDANLSPDFAVFPAATQVTELGNNKWNKPVPTNYTYQGAPSAAGWKNAAQYFMNASVQPGNTTSVSYQNATGAPRGKDEFILISAGIDRTYGTEDDITSFGSVEP